MRGTIFPQRTVWFPGSRAPQQCLNKQAIIKLERISDAVRLRSQEALSAITTIVETCGWRTLRRHTNSTLLRSSAGLEALNRLMVPGAHRTRISRPETANSWERRFILRPATRINTIRAKWP